LEAKNSNLFLFKNTINNIDDAKSTSIVRRVPGNKPYA
jgi:hypothetical protein